MASTPDFDSGNRSIEAEDSLEEII
ncbi:MAG: hypothetical protein QOG49_1091, partial [Frankiaceae bacterium]|nr:hypothetical protein [Frankiaceae bacterium]